MTIKPKAIIYAVGALVGLLVLAAIALSFFLDVNAYKPRFEAAASRAFGLDVSVAGPLEVDFFTGLFVTMEDVHIRNRGEELAAAKQVRLEIDVLPLLRRTDRAQGGNHRTGDDFLGETTAAGFSAGAAIRFRQQVFDLADARVFINKQLAVGKSQHGGERNAQHGHEAASYCQTRP
jgi:hypothetical protein